MDYRREILEDRSKNHIVELARHVGHDPRRFARIMALLHDTDQQVSQRAAWIMSYCADFAPELIEPHLGDLVKLLDSAQPDGIKRNVLRLLQFRPIPEALQGEVVTRVFDLMQAAREPVAIKAFGMTVLFNISREQPGIAHELRLVIEDLLPHGTPAIRHRGNKILQALDKAAG